MRKGWGAWRLAGAIALLAISAGLTGLNPSLVQAKGPAAAAQLDTIASTQLPAQGRDMLTLIYQGGPFRYDKDGTVFGNRERILPANNRGYYREYTVKTPGERSRGARRIVCGGLKPAAPDACYYTDDHYASFRKIVQ
ncbi:ribonuclease domain-containing protein [Polaromonas sp.]|uniref:ribonuclease domain-containing protein n=1 Tax=Polaromonas sp. TaxID=1869339 RepID=UPI003FA6E15C